MSRMIRVPKIVVVLAAVALVDAARAETIYVCCGGGEEFLAIQEGIDAAVDGDEVVVRDGTYVGDNNRDLDLGGKRIVVRSENGPDACIIDCEGAGRGFHFHSGEYAETVVDGFTIRNGAADSGAGMLCDASSPTILNCRLCENVAAFFGGGIHCTNGSRPLIQDCAFHGNQVTGASYPNSGGGVAFAHGSDATLTGCTITGNYTPNDAAGVKCYLSDPTIHDCIVSGNYTDGWGGGFTIDQSDPTVANCRVSGNYTDYEGGGIQVLGHYGPASSTIESCTVVGNRARNQGGGISSWGTTTTPTITGCTLSGNSAGQSGGAFYGQRAASDSTVINCILWGDDAPLGPEISLYPPGSTLTISYSDVEGGEEAAYVGIGCTLNYDQDTNIEVDPLFVGGPSGVWSADGMYDAQKYQVVLTDSTADWTPGEFAGAFVRPVSAGDPNDPKWHFQLQIVTNTETTVTVWADWNTINDGASWVSSGATYQIHDYHLTADSPCIDAGDPDWAPPGGTDIDGQCRVWDGDGDGTWRVDMGSDEFGSGCYGDLDDDGDVDLADLATLLAAYDTCDGEPYWDPAADLDGSGCIGLADLAALLAVYGTGCP